MIHPIAGGAIMGHYTDYEIPHGPGRLTWLREQFADERNTVHENDSCGIRVTRWERGIGPGPPPERDEAFRKSLGLARDVDSRLGAGEPHAELWARSGLREIRFDSDGHCYVVPICYSIEAEDAP